MASTIQQLLAQIESAVYGRDVRSSIHDAIEQCYSDISTAASLADDATASANTAAQLANTNANLANTAAGNAQTIIDRWNGNDGSTALSATISMAINDANTARTNANNAATAANNAATAASTAATNAQDAVDDVEEILGDTTGLSTVAAAITAASSAATTATTAAGTANTAAANATSAASTATTAANDAQAIVDLWNGVGSSTGIYDEITGTISNAQSAINSAQDATEDAQAIVDRWTGNDGNPALSETINTAIGNANDAADSVEDVITETRNLLGEYDTLTTVTVAQAINQATQAASTASSAAADATDAKNAANAAASTANSQATRAQTAADNASNAISLITTGLTITSQEDTSVGAVPSVYVEKDLVNNTLLLRFNMVRGATGASMVIKGDGYDTPEDLAQNVSNPEVGDMYNVGTTLPYDVYRWTGTYWQNQGPIGFNLDNLETVDLNNIWSNVYTPVSGSPKYINDDGLLYLVQNKIVSALGTLETAINGKIDAATGVDSVLNENSTNPVQNRVIKLKFNAVESAIDEKVDKDGTKVLSEVNFSQSDKTKLDGIGAGANRTEVDTSLNGSSTNPVRNSAITAGINGAKAETVTLSHAIAAEYVQDVYARGDFCMHNNELYQCTNPSGIQNAEAWNANHWTKRSLLGDSVRASGVFGLTYQRAV